MSTMLPRDRIDYSAIVDRPPYKLPGGARVVLWTIVNLEVWDVARRTPQLALASPTGGQAGSSVPDWSRHEYGMRVGVWRFFDLFRRFRIAPTLGINADVCENYARVAEQALIDGWEFMGRPDERVPGQNEADQAAMILRSLDTLERFTGRRPIGWLDPGLAETPPTVDLLAAAGIKYVADWVYDDEPTVIRTAHGPLVTLPYTMELNDVAMMAMPHHESDYLFKRATDQFDQLYSEGRSRAKIMTLAIHPCLSGQPHRIKYLEQIYEYVSRFDGVLHWSGAEILKWYRSVSGFRRGIAA